MVRPRPALVAACDTTGGVRARVVRSERGERAGAPRRPLRSRAPARWDCDPDPDPPPRNTRSGFPPAAAAAPEGGAAAVAVDGTSCATEAHGSADNAAIATSAAESRASVFSSPESLETTSSASLSRTNNAGAAGMACAPAFVPKVAVEADCEESVILTQRKTLGRAKYG